MELLVKKDNGVFKEMPRKRTKANSFCIYKKEFEDSIDFHINQLKSFHFGRINPAIFNRYCYGDSIYQYYHEWRKGRITYGFDIFKAHLMSEYKRY